jgi:hypothetical protein
MVQTNATLIEWKGVRWVGELVKPDERLTFDKPDSSSKRARAFVLVNFTSKSRSYHWTLRSRSLTVRVTCAMVGNSGTAASS